MKAQLIDGKRISAEIKAEAAEEAAALKAKGITPCLAVVLVGDDSASQVYVNNKKKACEAVGIRSVSHVLSGGTTEEALLELIAKLNADQDIHGILVQMPVPKQIDERKVILAIDPKKDVDCFHPVNVGNLHTGGEGFLPCTPAGIIELIKRTFHRREAVCCYWQKQYRRKACSYAVDAGERHCDDLPFQNKESGGNLSGGRYHCQRSGQGKHSDGRYGKVRCDSH